jgi:thiamine phosphate synthase YjbQ (UPF0047 family)
MPLSLFRIPREHTPITYRSKEGIAFADLTGLVSRTVRYSGVKEGFVLIKNCGVGASLLVQEAEQHIERDLLARLSEFKPHAEWPQLFQPYQALPIAEGKLKLGRYQSIFMMLMDDEQVPNFSVLPVEGKLATLIVDTGKPVYPVIYESNGDVSRGSEKIFDITEAIARIVRVVNEYYLENFSVSVGTGHTTCALYYDAKREGVDGLVNRMNQLAPPEAVYRHNDLSSRFNVPADERQNGRAHVIGAVMSPSLVIGDSQVNGKIYFVELDGPRARKLNIVFSPLSME